MAALKHYLPHAFGNRVVFFEACLKRVGALLIGVLVGIQGMWDLSMFLETGRKGQGCLGSSRQTQGRAKRRSRGSWQAEEHAEADPALK